MLNKLKNIFKCKTKIAPTIKDCEEKQKEIKVIITWKELQECSNTELPNYFKKRLIDAEIPISLCGDVLSGTLERVDDYINRSYIFTWKP